MAQIVVVEVDDNGSTVPLVCAFFPKCAQASATSLNDELSELSYDEIDG